MRVIAGSLGGRVFASPRSKHTHPMSEKARGALFNSLGDVHGLTALDAYAGSGALTIEAISRGVATDVAIDLDKGAYTTIVKNVHNLGLEEQVQTFRANVSGWSNNNSDRLFDLVLLDPPYNEIRIDVLRRLAKHCKPGGVIVLSLPPDDDFVLPVAEFKILARHNYGDATLAFYRRIS